MTDTINATDGQGAYFARDFAVMGCVKDGEQQHFLLIATVNPNIKDGAAVAAEIASALNEVNKKEHSHV